MNKLKYILLICLAALLGVSVYLYTTDNRLVYNPTQLLDSMPTNIDMQLKGVNFTEVSDSGRREWTMEAETLHYLRKKNLFVFDKVKATIYTDDGPVYVTAKTARYNKTSAQVWLTGGITVRDDKGYELKTRHAHYSVEKQVLSANGHFELTGPDVQLTGKGCTVNVADYRMNVLSRADLTLKSSRGAL